MFPYLSIVAIDTDVIVDFDSTRRLSFSFARSLKEYIDQEWCKN